MFTVFLIVVQLQLSQCFHGCSPPLCPLHPLCSHSPHPVVHIYGSLIHVPRLDSSSSFLFFPLLSLSPLPSVHSQFVLYFHGSSSILLHCLFCSWGSKIIIVCRWHESVHRKLHRLHQKTAQSNKWIWQNSRVQSQHSEIEGILIH